MLSEDVVDKMSDALYELRGRCQMLRDLSEIIPPFAELADTATTNRQRVLEVLRQWLDGEKGA